MHLRYFLLVALGFAGGAVAGPVDVRTYFRPAAVADGVDVRIFRASDAKGAAWTVRSTWTQSVDAAKGTNLDATVRTFPPYDGAVPLAVPPNAACLDWVKHAYEDPISAAGFPVEP